MTEILNEIDKKQAELNNLQPIKPEYMAKIREQFKLEYNYYSNNLEGNTLNLGETKSLILQSYNSIISKRGKDITEMKGHIEVYDEIGFLQDKILTQDHQPLELNQYLIKNLHKQIFVEDEKRVVEENGITKYVDIPAGNYKTSPNSVKTITGEMFYYAEPTEVPQMMADLLDWYNTVRKSMNPVVLASIFHYKFIRIHPFGDGNGRMARFLLNMILQSSGYPIAIIKSDQESKNKYLQSLAKTDQNFISSIDSILKAEDQSLFEPFIIEIANSVLSSLDLMIRGAKGEDISETESILKQFEMELKLKETHIKQDIFWLTKNDNLEKLLQNGIIPTLTKIEDFCFILAQYNFAEMFSQVWDDKVSLVWDLVGNLKNGQSTRNNWNGLLDKKDWYSNDWEKIDTLNIKYNFESYAGDRTKNLSLDIKFVFTEFEWFLNIDFGKYNHKQTYIYGDNITDEDIKNCITFLVEKSKILLSEI